MRRVSIAFALLPALARPGVAQSPDGCGVELRTGPRPAYPHSVVDGSPTSDMAVGWSLMIGGSCEAGPVGLGFGVEANTGPNLSLVHFLATAERRVRTGDMWTLSVRAGGGVAVTVGGLAGGTLIAAGDGRHFEEEVVGPALSAGIRAAHPLGNRWRLVLDAGWRGSLLDETDFDSGGEGTQRLLHIFPLTLGVRFLP